MANDTPPPPLRLRTNSRAPAPLVGMRREETPQGRRWIVQARQQDSPSGPGRLPESEPLPFDPAPQMPRRRRVTVDDDRAPGGPAG
ncbi:hypothetical protein AAFN86_07790 [Roseomonas sp. CAU 1739]|uniref:hypothetical protein n=1 Tax=Roseomonas sp. CAU 1739 TaxID=3140364 RepID=UPI00325C1E23